MKTEKLPEAIHILQIREAQHHGLKAYRAGMVA